ncbi:MAG: SGNH/GDSL hydrolase family protein [Deltaproteobacteria bacterium]|nr:SGNH/GDSL hydrolase family protein [Deltaproteobacteria bacterium]
MAGGRQRAREWLTWTIGLALLVSVVIMGLRVAIEVGAIVAGGFTPLLFNLIGSWQVVLFATLVLALALAWGRGDHLPSLRAFRRQPVRWLVGALLLLIALRVTRKGVAVNSLGLVSDAPNKTFWMDKGHPQRQPARVQPNQYGFRDSPWTSQPALGTTRVLLIGDSFVYGAGVADYEGLLHRQLARSLGQISPHQTWEVLNGGRPGWSHLSYFDAALRLMRELHPKVIVIGSLGGSDWDVFDFQQQLDLLGRRLFYVAWQVGAVTDLNELSLRSERTMCPAGEDCPRMGEPLARARLERLLAEAAASHTEVVVWEYFRPISFFAKIDAPNFHRASWPAGFEQWTDDPALAIPIDRHPTAAGNAVIASTLARILVRLVNAAPTSAEGVR